VLAELAEQIDPVRLCSLAVGAKTPEIQRLGFLLDPAGQPRLADPLLRVLSAKRYRPVPLAPDAPRGDARAVSPWRIIPNEGVDVDAVVGYALRLGSAVTVARVGHFLEQHREELLFDSEQLAELRRHAPRQPRYLDPARTAGRLARGWNLVVPEEVAQRRWEELRQYIGADSGEPEAIGEPWPMEE